MTARQQGVPAGPIPVGVPRQVIKVTRLTIRIRRGSHLRRIRVTMGRQQLLLGINTEKRIHAMGNSSSSRPTRLKRGTTTTQWDRQPKPGSRMMTITQEIVPNRRPGNTKTTWVLVFQTTRNVNKCIITQQGASSVLQTKQEQRNLREQAS